MNQFLDLLGRLGKRPEAKPKTPEADRLAADHPLLAEDAARTEPPIAPVVSPD